MRGLDVIASSGGVAPTHSYWRCRFYQSSAAVGSRLVLYDAGPLAGRLLSGSPGLFIHHLGQLSFE